MINRQLTFKTEIYIDYPQDTASMKLGGGLIAIQGGVIYNFGQKFI
jgi:hypothetical protein